MPDGKEKIGRRRRPPRVALIVLGGVAVLAALLWSAWVLTPLPGDTRPVDPLTAPVSGEANTTARDRGSSVQLNQVPDHVVRAVLAAEAAAPAPEAGVTLEGLARGLWFALTGRGTGDFAITQRMAAGQHPQDHSFPRRVADVAVAVKAALSRSPEWVLERYLNVLDLGGSRGLQAGARAFFGKDVQELSVSEGAYLAAAIRRQDPAGDAASAPVTDLRARWRAVIDAMHRQGTLTAPQAAAQRFPATLAEDRAATRRSPATRPASAGVSAPSGGAGPRIVAATGPATGAPARAALTSAPRKTAKVAKVAAPGEPAEPRRKPARRARQNCPPGSIICLENELPGNPPSEWDVVGAGSPDIQGYPTQISVNHGDTIDFKINTPATDYRLDIYRFGWYGGMGARLITTIQPSVPLPQTQPDCVSDAATGLVDCGTWAVSASWAVPATAVTGVYEAKLVREDGTAGDSQILFVVRDDQRSSAVVFKTSDTTWQAYNRYGGNSLYFGQPANRAYKVSYNRPITTRGVSNGPPNYFFNSEYPMLRWIERNAYDVGYISSIDAVVRPGLLLGHEALLSVGHDEYWSEEMRDNFAAARDDGVDVAFFSANEVFWKTRWEPSIDGSDTPFRTMTCYKETLANAKIDPSPQWTGTWRDPRFSPPSNGGRPENQLTGTLFIINGVVNDAIQVPSQYAAMRLWRNTSIANLQPGDVATLSSGTLGFEWDNQPDNSVAPPGLARYSSTTLSYTNKVLLDFGSTYGAGSATHHLTLYRQPSGGGLVFGAGTIQWPWGLDAVHDRDGAPIDIRIQQATVNLFADFGLQPATLQTDLVPATQSTDTAPPTSALTAPAGGSTVVTGRSVTISGTASDTGGGVVAGVEVSTDNGASWQAATGFGPWQYTWVPQTAGDTTLLVRAVDDIGNLQTTLDSRPVTVVGSCPCSLWPSTTVPAVLAQPDSRSVELGVKFQTSQEGAILGIRFYKGAGNTGTHVGNLWTSTGQLLARATFTNETATGWQQVDFPAPVQVTPGTTYVASYFAPAGHYALNQDYFTSARVNGPLTAPTSTAAGGNGVYRYGSGTAFPTSTYRSSNYWVDVSFSPTSLFPSTSVPAVVNASDARAVTLGVRFRALVPGTIRGIRFYKGSQNTGTHIGTLWSNTGQQLATATFTNETASGWQQVLFSTPVRIDPGTTYVASYNTQVGRFSYNQNFFTTQYNSPPLIAPASGVEGNGVYRYTSQNLFPTTTYKASNYWVDVVFDAD
ncbi:DUF4082 domain-containing protein [Nonomuraea rhodomycinica]|uniref:DUF4082 domain-containing protein n=1 Tax=Nonomuraea rhodomycinica TaxID=1712872 RepID=A0A7Y6ISM8_9ACTN|nr:DUF4082 domain-containing protein [Nonomuraea rhodomycinica]NUW42414.1 DUF4082 domain-containing protein [Nonomuraea rhodomycinica]